MLCHEFGGTHWEETAQPSLLRGNRSSCRRRFGGTFCVETMDRPTRGGLGSIDSHAAPWVGASSCPKTYRGTSVFSREVIEKKDTSTKTFAAAMNYSGVGVQRKKMVTETFAR